MRIFACYHADIFNALSQDNPRRAIRQLFEFSNEFCPGFESDIVELNAELDSLDSGKGLEAEAQAIFIQAFHRKWIAMEDFVLNDLLSLEEQDEDEAQSVTAVLSEEPGDLIQLKKELIANSGQTGVTLISLDQVVRNLGDRDRFRRKTKPKFTLGPVSLNIGPGQIVGVVGPNGAGKTTLLRVIAGDLATSDGMASYPGLIDGGAENADRSKGYWPKVKSQIAFVPPMLETVHAGTLMALWMTAVSHGAVPGDIEKRINVTMHKYGLNQFSDRRVSELSTGYRLRFELARILMSDPNILVLDEPLANLDRNAQLTVLDDLKMLAASVDAPRAIVISSHDIQAIESIADHLVFLDDGKVIFSGTPAEVGKFMDLVVFEIVVHERQGEFEKFLHEAGAIETDRRGGSILAVFPKGTRQADVMTAVSGSGLQLRSFTELSESLELLLLKSRLKCSQAVELETADAVRVDA